MAHVVQGKGHNDIRLKGIDKMPVVDSGTMSSKPGMNAGVAGMSTVRKNNLKGEGGPV